MKVLVFLLIVVGLASACKSKPQALAPASVREWVPIAMKGFAGTWRLDLAKSEIPPVTKSQVLTIDTDGVHVTMREELVNDKGDTLVITVEGKFDGQDYPVKGTPFADTVSYRLLDPHTIEGIAKKNGRVCVKETAVLSQDEHIVRVTYLSYDERGNTHTSHGLFQRIDPP